MKKYWEETAGMLKTILFAFSGYHMTYTFRLSENSLINW